MKRILLLALLAIPGWASTQTLLYNDGAMLKIDAGATLLVEGGIQNTASGTIDNDGTLEVQGNFVNAGTWENSQANTLKFTGAPATSVTPGSAIFHNVVVQKDAGVNVTLLGNMTVNNNLDFNATGANRVLLGNFNLVLGNTATATGADADEYVATNGTGFMQKNVNANGAFTFPVGDITNYSPLASTYSGSAYAAANVKTKVNDAVHPNIPGDAESHVSRYWDIESAGITGYSNALVGTYVDGDIVGTENLIKGASYSGTTWSYADAANVPASNTISGTVTQAVADYTGSNFYGTPNLIVFLRGGYLATNNGAGNMNTTLTSNATIEAQMLTSPYVDAPASVTDVPTGVVDWIKLELRDPASPSTVLGRASVFLKNDGTVVGLDGVSPPRIENGLPTSIVGVVHRNHLSIRTPNIGINVTGNPTPYNFSTSLAMAFDGPATNDAMVQMTSGKWVMWAGNANSNANVRYGGPANDHDYLLGTILGGSTSTILTNVYSVGDLNLNGVVRYGGPNNDHDFFLGQTLGGNTATIRTQSY